MLIAFISGTVLLGLGLFVSMASEFAKLPNSLKKISQTVEDIRRYRNLLSCAIISIIFVSSLSTMVNTNTNHTNIIPYQTDLINLLLSFMLLVCL